MGMYSEGSHGQTQMTIVLREKEKQEEEDEEEEKKFICQALPLLNRGIQ
jgi:hypothetical protein